MNNLIEIFEADTRYFYKCGYNILCIPNSFIENETMFHLNFTSNHLDFDELYNDIVDELKLDFKDTLRFFVGVQWVFFQ